MRKARQDERALEILLSNPDAPYEVMGFHAQQAVEKLLKAVLAHSNVPYRRVHDVVELLDSLRDTGIIIPDLVEETRRLSPFAVDYRYDDIFEREYSTMRRDTFLELVQATRTWVEVLLKAHESE